jgi:glycosyltransferase involved in cell wall biosynthesis
VLSGKKIVVVMPAYNAERTLRRTYEDLPHEIIDLVILVDDMSIDRTPELARELDLHLIRHERNMGYGANQKTCYDAALGQGADVVVMVHPDYQYDPRLVTSMAGMITSGVYDVALGSRILGSTALNGGMPRYKFLANRVLTLIQNLALGAKLSEWHTGYRVFSRGTLETLPYCSFSDDFIFDNQILVEAVLAGLKIGEISCPTKYFAEASSISFGRGVRYGLGVLGQSLRGLVLRLRRGRRPAHPAPRG